MVTKGDDERILEERIFKICDKSLNDMDKRIDDVLNSANGDKEELSLAELMSCDRCDIAKVIYLGRKGFWLEAYRVWGTLDTSPRDSFPTMFYILLFGRNNKLLRNVSHHDDTLNTNLSTLPLRELIQINKEVTEKHPPNYWSQVELNSINSFLNVDASSPASSNE